jgi:small subunit ribosomal protein S8
MNISQLSRFTSTINIARQGRFKTIKVDNTNLTSRLLELFQEIGIIRGYMVMENDSRFKVFMKYKHGSLGLIFKVAQVSKSSKRVYVDMIGLYKIKERYGKIIYILSTPKGILSDAECITQRVGGEVLLKIVL